MKIFESRKNRIERLRRELEEGGKRTSESFEESKKKLGDLDWQVNEWRKAVPPRGMGLGRSLGGRGFPMTGNRIPSGSKGQVLRYWQEEVLPGKVTQEEGFAHLVRSFMSTHHQDTSSAARWVTKLLKELDEEGFLTGAELE
jgi:hypothetical protein